MAGDLKIDERAVVISTPSTERSLALAESVSEQGARVLHRYGPRVMIAEVSGGVEEDVRSALGEAEMTASPEELSETEDLDPIGKLGLAAFQLRQSGEYLEAKQRRPYENVTWDTEGELLPPDPPPELRRLLQPPGISRAMAAKAVQGSTSERMTGSIAVGIIIVSGPTAALQFSQQDTLKVIAEVQNGLGWLASQNHPANVTWNYDIHSVTVNVQPGGGGDKEALWRDPAMVQLGYPGNWQGVTDYVEHIRTQYRTQWTYVGYFTKYPLDWFAYASIGGPRLVMQYANDGWGPDNIDRVFAHETGHVFQAPDEYAASQCNCGGSWGVYDEPNGNCETCAAGGGVDCIMRSNSWAMCHWTPYHFGFPEVWPATALGATVVDGGRPYVFVEGSDGNVWVNWWSGSRWNWAFQGLPLGAGVAAEAGAITVDAARPYVFVKGSDGNLWVNWWSGSAWSWSNQGTPSGVKLGEPMGAITVDGGRPYVFVKGSDGNLWVNWWSGSAWSWSNQGTPSGLSISEAMGAITVDGGRPYAFVKGSDGNLWVNWWSGSAWSWSNQGTPSGVGLGESMGAITVDGGRPYVFVKGSDGNLWVNWWSGSAWSWANQGTPGGVGLGEPMGAITVDGGRPYVFVKGSDGNLWVNWWSGSAWSWSNQGTPSGVGLAESMGAITVDGGRPYVFVKGSDGNLWVNWWSGSAWSWAKQFTPSP